MLKSIFNEAYNFFQFDCTWGLHFISIWLYMRPSISFNLIVQSRSNTFLEPTSTKQWGWRRKQREPLIGFKLTTDRVWRATHHAAPQGLWMIKDHRNTVITRNLHSEITVCINVCTVSVFTISYQLCLWTFDLLW